MFCLTGARILLYERPSDPWQAGPYRQLTVGARFDLCLVPTRSEPYGHVGLEAISAGLPTLMSEQSVLASMVRRLVPDPGDYLGMDAVYDYHVYYALITQSIRADLSRVESRTVISTLWFVNSWTSIFVSHYLILIIANSYFDFYDLQPLLFYYKIRHF